MDHSLPPRAEILPEVWLDARLALWLAEPRLLVLADVHWGYAASHRAAGNLLPLWGDGEIERRMDGLVADYRPAEVLWLGDSLHTLEGRRAAEAYLERATVPTTVLGGNHDRAWMKAGAVSLQRGGYFFHHGDRALTPPAGAIEVIGHHHPALSWNDGAGGRFKLPALVFSPERIILPAFSPWAAGAPWNHRLQPGQRLYGLAPHRILPFAAPSAVPA